MTDFDCMDRLMGGVALVLGCCLIFEICQYSKARLRKSQTIQSNPTVKVSKMFGKRVTMMPSRHRIDPEDTMTLLSDIDNDADSDVVFEPVGASPSPYEGLSERVLLNRLLDIYDQRAIAEALAEVDKGSWCRETINRWAKGKAEPRVTHAAYQRMVAMLPTPKSNTLKQAVFPIY